MDRRTIGGSKVAGILGISPWTTPYDVYLQIVEGVQQEPTEAMYWGTVIEEKIRLRYVALFGYCVKSSLPQVTHPLYEFLTANLDGLVDDLQAVLEIKMANDDKDWGQPGTDQIPPYYLTQVVEYMAIMDLDLAIVVVLFGGNRLEIYRVHRDKELEGNIIEELCKFWTDHIEAKKPPPQGNSKLRAAWIKKRWPTDTDPVREATPYEIKLLSTLQYFRTVSNVSELIVEQITEEIKTRIGNAAGLMWDGGRVMWKQSRGRAVTSWKDLALAQSPSADLIQEHTVGKPGARPFLVPQIWKKDAVAFVEAGGESHPVLSFEGLLQTAYPGKRSELLETLKEEGGEDGTENHTNNYRELQTD